MIVTLGDIIIDRLDELPFMDKFAGIIRVLTYKEQGPNNTFIRKSFPADCKISLDECKKNNRYLDLCPDSKKKSVIYLEDNGIRPERIEGDWVYWVASIDLIAWLNLPLLGAETCSYSSIAMQGIFSKILIPQFNYENEIYYKIEYKEISKVLFDNRYTKDTIYRKVRKLSELGILKPYCYNQTIGSSFFSITELFKSLTMIGHIRTP